MKDKDYNRLIQLTWVGGGFIPANEKAEELASQLTQGEVVSFQEVTARDLAFHKGYMALLGFIYGYMPPRFKAVVPRERFYQWLKHLKGQYNVLFEFKDGTKLVEYESIAFGNMSEHRFREYVKEQLPWIYENVLGAYFTGEMFDNIVATIEEEFQKFFDKLK